MASSKCAKRDGGDDHGTLPSASHARARCNGRSRRVLSRARSLRLRASLRGRSFTARAHDSAERWPVVAAPKAPLLDAGGNKAKDVSLEESVFGADVKEHLLHEVIRAEL